MVKMIFCDCCPSPRKMAELEGTTIDIRHKSHGTWHHAETSIRTVLERLSGTVEGSAIVSYVQKTIGG